MGEKSKLELAKEALLDAIIEGDINPDTLAKTYDILVQAELNEKVVSEQLANGFFKPHCHHDLNPFDEEIG